MTEVLLEAYLQHMMGRIQRMRGPNRQYNVAPNVWLLRNSNSVDPTHDGWLICGPEGSHYIMPRTALDILLEYRRSR